MLPPLADVIEMPIQCKMVPFSTELTTMFRDLDGGSKPPPYVIIVIAYTAKQSFIGLDVGVTL